MKRSVLPWWGLLCRLVVGGVLLVAGALKLPSPRQSVAAVNAYELLPDALVRPVGYGLPIVEILVGLLLVLGLLTRASAVVAFLLMLAFVIGIAWAWSQGLSIDCGCFGGGGKVADGADQYPIDIARDAGLALMALWLVIRPRTALALDTLLFGQTERSSHVAEVG